MHHHHDDGAAAPGLPAPERLLIPETRMPAGALASLGEDKGQEGQAHSANDCAAEQIDAKATATAIARAALLGIEARTVGPDAWLLRHAAGAHIGTVQGLPMLLAAIAGFEAARDDMRALLRRMGGAA